MTKRPLTLHILLFIIGFVLFLDGVILILFKKIHLGTILPILIGASFCAYVLFFKQIQNFLKQKVFYQRTFKLIQIGFVLWVLSFIGFCIYLNQFIQQRQTFNFKPEIIIVLGSQVKNGYPTPALKSRLDQSALLAEQYPHSYLLMTGGVDFGEQIAEADVMADYLMKFYHISAHRILIENKSTSTELNLKYGENILNQYGLNKRQAILIVSNDFHLLRAEKIATKLGYTHISSFPASTPLTIRYNAWLREYFAFISGYVLNEY
ncbi:YdcF family protein [Moraxella sp. ZY210820]|uniref:YdcF family protein n=1 Tax=unclassified Moraxella TaxID=2685852 RepID=UPI00273136CF|nr:YdcF family protein [Moraxella sp. ZY210820]WLF83078.1 YdcF family protein [Moraxella sp. ZY210820]